MVLLYLAYSRHTRQSRQSVEVTPGGRFPSWTRQQAPTDPPAPGPVPDHSSQRRCERCGGLDERDGLGKEAAARQGGQGRTQPRREVRPLGRGHHQAARHSRGRLPGRLRGNPADPGRPAMVAADADGDLPAHLGGLRGRLLRQVGSVHRRWSFIRTHKLDLLMVLLPMLRLLRVILLLRKSFATISTERIASSLISIVIGVVVVGAFLEWRVEYNAPGANITTKGKGLGWAVV